MAIEKINDKIYLLKGLRSSNIYYFDFGKKVFIDTGYFEQNEKNFDEFSNYGIDLKKIDYIINTHSHGDHNGGNTYLKRINPGLKVFSSENTKPYQTKRKSLNLFFDSEDIFEEYEIDRELKENDTIDLDGCILKVIETKGHSIDSISLYLEDKKILFSGDSIYNKVIVQLDYYQDLALSLEELFSTYDKLLNLNLETIYTGHGDYITNPNENFNYCLRKMKRFKNDMQLALINNLIPSAQFLISKNKFSNKLLIHENIRNNLLKLSQIFFIDQTKIDKIIEKVFAMMRLLNIATIDEDNVFLNGNLNEYFSNIST